MKLRGFAGLAVLLLGATTLLTGCDDKADSSPAPAPVTTKAPPQTPAADPSDEPSKDPTTPADEEKDPATSDKSDFCKVLMDKAAELQGGKDISQVTKEELEKMVDVMGELADQAPADVKGPMTTIHEVYADVISGKTKTTDTAEMKKVADATIAYTTWTVTHCAPPSN